MTVVSTVDRHRAVDPGRHRRRQEHRAGAGLLLLPRHPGGVAQLPGGDPRHLLRQAVRLRPVRGRCDAVVRHHRLLRQAAGRGHRGHGPGAGGGRARHRRELAAMDQLRRPAAGDAAHDRARPLPVRHQLPRVGGGRHRRRRRHRRDAEHRLRPLRVRFGRRHPADHHRHRDGWWNIPPATFAAGCSDGGRDSRTAPRSGSGASAARSSRSGRRGSSASRSSSIAGSSSPTRRSGRSSCDAPTQAGDLAARMVPPDWGFIAELVAADLGHHQHRNARHRAWRSSSRCRWPIARRATPRRARRWCGRWRCSSSCRRARSIR